MNVKEAKASFEGALKHVSFVLFHFKYFISYEPMREYLKTSTKKMLVWVGNWNFLPVLHGNGKEPARNSMVTLYLLLHKLLTTLDSC